MASQRVRHDWATELSWTELNCKEIKLVNPKGNQTWMFIGRTDAEAETPILWSPVQRADSLEKTLLLGKIKCRWRMDKRGCDGWIASLTQWTWVWVSFGVGVGQGSLVCYGPWDCRVRQDWVSELTDGTGCHEFHYFECWVLSQLLHFPLSLSLRGSLILLFVP